MQRLSFLCLFFLLNVTFVYADLDEFEELADLRINEVQYIGTHNSYHLELDQSADILLMLTNYGEKSKWPARRLVPSLSYSHPPLDVQLKLEF